jgi:hypothetical protein
MDDATRQAEEVADRYADGLAALAELRAVIETGEQVRRMKPVTENAFAAIFWFTDDDLARGVSLITGNAAWGATGPRRTAAAAMVCRE